MMSNVDYKRLESAEPDSKEALLSESSLHYERGSSQNQGLPQSQRYQNTSTSCWSFWSWRTVFEALLATTALLSLAVIYLRTPVELGPGSAAFVHIPTVPTKIQASDYWIEVDMFYNHTTLVDKMRRFNELSGDGRGLIMLDNWRDYNLPKPQTLNVTYNGAPPSIKDSYTVAYYHHIHCIATAAKLFFNARTGNGNVEEDDEHMVHCLEVLRTAVMCFADTTLEDGIDYWENTHQCRDHSTLQNWAQDRAQWNFTAMIGDRVDFL